MFEKSIDYGPPDKYLVAYDEGAGYVDLSILYEVLNVPETGADHVFFS
jgi:hypothetical protein